MAGGDDAARCYPSQITDAMWAVIGPLLPARDRRRGGRPRVYPDRAGAENCVTSCDLGVFVDQAAGPVRPQHPDTGAWGKRMCPPSRWVLLQRPVWPVGVVVIDVLTEDQSQVPFAGDSILSRHSRRTPPASVRRSGSPGRLDGRLEDAHVDRCEHGVERGGEFGVPVPDQGLPAIS
jgi:hypothetical protein